MIKIVRWLEKNRSLLLLVLASPLLYFFLANTASLQIAPPSPYPQYSLEFSVPGRASDEIIEKSILPAEKLLNGLPQLISLETRVTNQKAAINIKFSDEVSKDQAYLFIQEKLDRVKFAVSRDVKSIKVSSFKPQAMSNIEVQFKNPIPVELLRKNLEPYSSNIVRTWPSLDQKPQIQVIPNLKKLYTNQVPLSQISKALKSTSFSTSIGRKNQIHFETGRTFQTLDDVKNAVVGVRGQRPIRLVDVAEFQLMYPESISNFQIFTRGAEKKPQALIKRLGDLGIASISYPESELIKQKATQPLIALVAILLISILLFKLLFGPSFSIFSYTVFSILLAVHYFFWKILLLENIYIVDLHSLVLCYAIGTLFWGLLMLRIRSYFQEEYKKLRPLKTIEQATLFAQAECMPLFAMLVFALWVVHIPLIDSNINLPSQLMLKNSFYLGLPILLIILAVTPVFGGLKWLDRDYSFSKFKIHWKPQEKSLKYLFFGSSICVPLIMFLFHLLPIGVSSNVSNTPAKFEHYRGYSNQLLYVGEKNLSASLFSSFENMASTPIKNWTVTPTGLASLSKVDFTSFTKTLEDMLNNSIFGEIQTSDFSLPISWKWQAPDWALNNILLENQKGKDPIVLKSLFDQDIEIQDDSKFRTRIQNVNQYIATNSPENLRPIKSEQILPSQWTAYLHKQLMKFELEHFNAALFLFILLSLYLNSFLRSIVVIIFTLPISTSVYAVHLALDRTFHVDSLWLVPFCSWIFLTILLYFTRIADVERTRGLSREVAVKEINKFILPPVFLLSISISAFFIFMGLFELIYPQGSLGLWKESLVQGLIAIVALFFLSKNIFPLFYLHAEEAIENLAFNFFSIYTKMRDAILKK